MAARSVPAVEHFWSPMSQPGRLILVYRLAPVALLVLLSSAIMLSKPHLIGWANPYYASAVRSGMSNWTAFLFGSLDPANAITVDKPPAALWVMGLSAHAFGFSTISMILPQAIMGVVTALLVFLATSRLVGRWAGLVAGLMFVFTPVVTLMFHYNHPDALLTMLLTAAALLVNRGIEFGRRRWMFAAGLVLGLAMLTKSLQAFLVLPSVVLVVLVAGAGSLWSRANHLSTLGLGFIAGAGWWYLTFYLWPHNARPWIGGSQDGTPLDLTFGFNGFDRILGFQDPIGGSGPAFGGDPGILRMFNSGFGTQASWLLPATLLLIIAGLLSRGRRPRTDPIRAALLLWGGWVICTVGVFSFMNGLVHPYYTVALAPGLAVAVAVAGSSLIADGSDLLACSSLIAAVAVSAWWAFVLLGWSPSFLPWLRWAIIGGALLACLLLSVRSRPQAWFPVGIAVAVITVLASPAIYSFQTAATPHGGFIPSAGPPISSNAIHHPVVAARGHQTTDAPRYQPLNLGGGFDGLGYSLELISLLRSADGFRWAAATGGAQRASVMMLQAGHGSSVLAVGGFLGRDAFPSLAQFVDLVEQNEIRYFIESGDPVSHQGVSRDISAWVRVNYRAVTVQGTTVYDLTKSGRFD